ncbi:MAG: serine O-acetyltransferase EpsC [Bdellovibrio sp.]
MRLKNLLILDLKRHRILQGRPNNINTAEVFLQILSPRFLPVVLCRVSHSLYRHKLSPLAKLFSLVNFVLFGIEISPQIEIGPGLFFPHTQGTVIGARKIGANAIIFQQVTLGAKDLDMGFNLECRPEIGDNVTIGAGAKILGGVFIGNDAKIGANSVVLSDIPARSVCVGIPGRIVNSES